MVMRLALPRLRLFLAGVPLLLLVFFSQGASSSAAEHARFGARDLALRSNTSTVQVPQLRLDASSPSLQICPRSGSGDLRDESAVNFDLAQVRQINAVDRSTVLLADLVNGSWIGHSPKHEAAEEFIYHAILVFDDLVASSSEASIELQLDLFDHVANLSVGNVTTFIIHPSEIELTLRIYNWPWQDVEGIDPYQQRLEVRLHIEPNLVDATVRPDPLSPSLTDILLHHEHHEQDETHIRLLQVVEMDGPAVSQVNGVPAVEFSVDVEQSNLILSFARFNSTLVYDPDLGILVGSTSSGSNDNLGVIVGVSVAVPLAVLVVLLAIGARIAWTIYRRHRSPRADEVVNYDGLDEGTNDDQL